MSVLLDRDYRARQNRVRTLHRRKPKRLLPSEFCRRHLRTDKQPGDRGYRAACIRLICEAIGLEHPTVNNWGATLDEKCPDAAQQKLAQADFERRLVDTVVSYPPAFEYLLSQGWEPPVDTEGDKQ